MAGASGSTGSGAPAGQGEGDSGQVALFKERRWPRGRRDGGSAGASGAGGAAGSGGGGSGGSGTPMRSPGCGKAPTLTSGTRTIQSSGQNRSFILRIPDNYDSNHPYRLIFAFHWNGGTATTSTAAGPTGGLVLLRAAAQANNSTIFVAPQGIGNGWANPGGQDLTFIDDMIRLIEGDLCVDTTQRLRAGVQLRRRHELRAGVCPADGLPRGRGLLRRAAQRVQRRHPARRLHRDPRSSATER